MNTDLSPDQISRFQTDGFLVLDQFLDEGELEEWRTVIMDAVQDRLALDPEVQQAFNAKYGSDELKLQNQDDPETFYANVFTQCLRLADSHADTARLIRDPRLGELAATSGTTRPCSNHPTAIRPPGTWMSLIGPFTPGSR